MDSEAPDEIAPTNRENVALIDQVKSSWSMRAFGAVEGDDNGYEVSTMNAGIGYQLSEYLRVVASAGVGRYSVTPVIPVRVGIERSSGGAAIEIGNQIVFHENDRCPDLVGRPRELNV